MPPRGTRAPRRRSISRRCAPRRRRVLPKETAALLARAKEACDRFAIDYRDYLLRSLATKGFDPAGRARGSRSRSTSSSARSGSTCRSRSTTTSRACRRSSSIERALFPWFDDVEAATDAIRAELLQAVMNEPGAFAPYVTGHANRPATDEQGMLNNPALERVLPVEERRAGSGQCRALSRRRCTRCATRRSRTCRTGRRRSCFRCCGPARTFRLTTASSTRDSSATCRSSCPAGAVSASATRCAPWVEGKALGCSTTPSSTKPGTKATGRGSYLLFDVWRPELTEDERQLVVSSVRGHRCLHSGRKPDWEI